MNHKLVLSKISTLLGIESEIELMAELSLKDGTKIGTDAEEFAVGVMAYVVSEDGEKMVLPTGEYESEDGTKMQVEDGEIKAIEKAEEKEEEEVEAEDKKEDEEEEMSKVDLSEYCTKSELIEALTELTSQIDAKFESIVKENTELKSELSKVSEFAAEEPIKHTKKTTTNLQTESLETGNKALDMILKYKNN